MENDNRLTIRFKHEVDLKNIKYIAQVMDTNPNQLIQCIIKKYIQTVKLHFDDSEKNDSEC